MGPDVKEKWYEICKFFVRKWLLGSPRSVKRFWMVLQTQYSFKLNWCHFRMTMESIKWFRLASKFLTNYVNLTDRKSHVWILKNLTKVSPFKKAHQKIQKQSFQMRVWNLKSVHGARRTKQSLSYKKFTNLISLAGPIKENNCYVHQFLSSRHEPCFLCRINVWCVHFS